MFTNLFTSLTSGQVPHQAPRERPARVAEQEALALQQKNRSYTLLEDSDDEEAGEATGAQDLKRRRPPRSHEGKQRKQHKHLRRRKEEDDEDKDSDEKGSSGSGEQ